MNLYCVNADDYDGAHHGNNLWVWADTPEQAVAYWRGYYDAEETPISVDEVPLNRGPGAIPWTEVPEVWRAS